MIMIKAVIRPERCAAVLKALAEAGYPAVTKLEVLGRGKQSGLKLGEVVYDELPKEMLLLVVPKSARMFVVDTIMNAARTGAEGTFGDGKIFITPVEEVFTISSGAQDA